MYTPAAPPGFTSRQAPEKGARAHPATEKAPHNRATTPSEQIKTASTPQLYLTLAEAAELLRVSTRTLRRWTSSDPTMPVLRVGHVIRFHRGRLERWLAQHEHVA